MSLVGDFRHTLFRVATGESLSRVVLSRWNETLGERLAQSSFRATRCSKCLFRPTRGQVLVSKEKFLGNEGRLSGLPDNPQHPPPGGALRLHSPRGAMTLAGVDRP